MLLKHKWVYITVIVILSPVTVFAQASLERLSSSNTIFGISLLRKDIGIITQRNITTINGNLDYGIDYNLKMTFQAGVGLTDADDVPPSPTGGIGLVYIERLGDSGLEYFAGGDFGAAFYRVVRESTNQVLERSRILNLSWTIGILKRLETQEGQSVNPFFTLSYARLWETSEANAEFTGDLEDLVLKKSSDYGNFAGEIGVEVELTGNTTGLAAFKFSFERFDAALRIGLNFQ